VWSPDSAWIAYTKRLDSQYHAVFAYSMAEGKAHQLTDGMSDAISPAWDASGKYMYFLASTNFALNTGWLDMTSYERPVRRSVYVAVLSKDEPSPLLPKSDEEPAKEDDEKKKEEGADADKGDDAKKPTGPEVKLDLEGFDQRILALGIPAGNYAALATGKEGVVFYADAGSGGGPFGGGGATLHRYDLSKKESKEFTKGVSSFSLSNDRKKMLIGSRGSWRVVGTDAPPQAGKGALKTSSIRMKVDPRAEWRQIFREAWRFQRDYLYVENVHGADWDAVYRMYEPWVEHIGHRADLTYLLDILGGEVSIGHSFTGGGDVPDVARVSTGLLGADIEVDQGRYRLAHIFSGENWNPGLQAPLSAPGIDAKVGDYVLAVNGQEITTDRNFHAYFEGTAGRQTVLLLNDRPSREGARDVTVVPVSSEGRLRQRAWIEGNRRKVDELSGGRLAYVWLPDTGQGGYTAFNRYYFAQQDKPAAVIDERFNGGGSAADYMVDVMARKLHGYFNSPVGERRPFTSPQAGIWGPKVRPADRNHHLGRTGGHLGCSAPAGRRHDDGPARRLLRPRRQVVRRERRRGTRHQGRADAEGVPGRRRPATRASGEGVPEVARTQPREATPRAGPAGAFEATGQGSLAYYSSIASSRAVRSSVVVRELLSTMRKVASPSRVA